MIGYIFNTETEAINSRELNDKYYGIPVHPEDITQNWCDYKASETIPVFYYIIYDESLLVTLGEPIDFNPEIYPF